MIKNFDLLSFAQLLAIKDRNRIITVLSHHLGSVVLSQLGTKRKWPAAMRDLGLSWAVITLFASKVTELEG